MSSEIHDLLPPTALAKPLVPVGTSIKAGAKSLHVGHTGTVAADYGSMLLVLSDEPGYKLAHSNAFGPGKYFQVDAKAYKIIKDSNET